MKVDDLLGLYQQPTNISEKMYGRVLIRTDLDGLYMDLQQVSIGVTADFSDEMMKDFNPRNDEKEKHNSNEISITTATSEPEQVETHRTNGNIFDYFDDWDSPHPSGNRSSPTDSVGKVSGNLIWLFPQVLFRIVSATDPIWRPFQLLCYIVIIKYVCR